MNDHDTDADADSWRDRLNDDREWTDDDGERVIAAVEGHLDQLEGRTQLHVECGTSASGYDFCHYQETVELDEPAYLADDLLVLPGFTWECPDCGQPFEFRINDVGVSRLV